MSTESVSETGGQGGPARRGLPWLLPLILLAATGLRLINLAGRPLWYDEAFAILYAQKPVSTMIQGTVAQVGGAAADVHPVFFYTLLHLWMSAFGGAPFAARCLSVVFGVAAVALVYALGREVAGRRAGLAAATICALAPLAVYYSQEARMYALLGLASAATALTFLRAWRTGKWGWWLGFGLSGALVLYAHNLGVVFLAALDLWAVGCCLKERRIQRLLPWVLAHILILALFAPWLAFLPSQLGKIRQAYWVQRPGLVSLIQTLLCFHFAYDNQSLPRWLLPPALFFCLLLPVMLTYTAVRWRRQHGDRHAQPDGAARWLMACLAVAPVVLLFLISQVRPVYVIRGLLPSAVAYYILLAIILVDVRTPAAVRWGLFVPSALIVAASLFNHYTYIGFPRAPFRELAGYLRTHAQQGAAIVHSNKLTYFPTYVYDRSLPESYLADEPGSPEDTLAPATQEALGLYASPDLQTATAGAQRVWLVMFARAIEEYQAAGYRDHPQREWMERHFTLVSVTRFGDLNLYEYETRPSPLAAAGGRP